MSWSLWKAAGQEYVRNFIAIAEKEDEWHKLG